ncbi:hypothetical protein F2P81_020714 [Scophthalmus maximus]|uniref:Uncharacterized protein n=1 Tax=Scophthalmus maximus TaxID=52904 RepID=A0A6A4S0S0_SCOMX|nr:hypothetical protein F2P81_020714 [Scophthalmus maximus]
MRHPSMSSTQITAANNEIRQKKRFGWVWFGFRVSDVMEKLLQLNQGDRDRGRLQKKTKREALHQRNLLDEHV